MGCHCTGSCFVAAGLLEKIEPLTRIQRLRYKDFHLAARPALIESDLPPSDEQPGLFEVEAMQDFAAAMEKRGISAWWRRAMDFA